MNLDVLKQIVKIAKDDGVSELKLESKDFKVEVRFSTGHVVPVPHTQHVVHQAPVSQAVLSTPEAPLKVAEVDTKLHIITSPFVGTFYTSPGPNKPVYTKLGDKVKAGQPLCVLEAMKIMNEIDADVAGEIIEICVENESLVEFGQPLFKIKLY